MPRKLATLAFALLIPALWLGAGCQRPGGSGPGAPLPARAGAATPAVPTPLSPRTLQAPKAPLVIFLGDSLTAGLGLPGDQAFPALLARQLRADGLAARVLNAGVSGDTTAGGLRRLSWLLVQHPALVVVGLGANDGLRGTAVPEIESNLSQLVARVRHSGAQVLLLGMQIPPNYGPDYTTAFAAVYPRVAKDMNVPLVPFLLAGVGGVPELNQADGIHPTAAGHLKVAANVKPYLEDLLRRKPPAAAAVAVAR